jgi:hypothetical protein
VHTTYTVQDEHIRHILYCRACGHYFSETSGTPLAGLRTPLSHIRQILTAVDEGLGINATCRTFNVSKNTVKEWERRLSGLKQVLLLYSLCHQFLQQILEGDELYTRVHHNRPPAESEGWTVVIMERASRFLWTLQCGQRDLDLFTQAIGDICQVIAQTADLTLLTDGERRYGNFLFSACCRALYTGKPGRPAQTLPEGVKVRLKNKGLSPDSARSKYEAPQPEHPQTVQNVSEEEIHANHVEAFNSALRRQLACFRRKANTYAKLKDALQRRLDVHWLLHNFIRPHFTTKIVPAVALNILTAGLSWAQLFAIQTFPFN